MKRKLAIVAVWCAIAGLGAVSAEVWALLRLRSLAAALTALVLMCGCPATSKVTRPRSIFAAAGEGWRDAGLGDPGNCLDGATVKYVASAQSFGLNCGGASPEHVAACWQHYRREAILRPGERVDSRGEPVIHEALHGLMACAGMPPDYAHANDRVWETGGSGSAQQRARRIYAGGR